MKKQPGRAGDLRRLAERRLRIQPIGGARIKTKADAQRILHELQVHEIELEMQNEQLKQSKAEIDASLERYTDLYDFAPVGYPPVQLETTARAASLPPLLRSAVSESDQHFGHTAGRSTKKRRPPLETIASRPSGLQGVRRWGPRWAKPSTRPRWRRCSGPEANRRAPLTGGRKDKRAWRVSDEARLGCRVPNLGHPLVDFWPFD